MSHSGFRSDTRGRGGRGGHHRGRGGRGSDPNSGADYVPRTSANGTPHRNPYESRGRQSYQGGKRSNAPFYDEHLDLEAAGKLLLQGKLVLGRLRVLASAPVLAFVSVPGVEQDVLIEGLPHRNRAMHGDIVALKIRPHDDWKNHQIQPRDDSGAFIAQDDTGGDSEVDEIVFDPNASHPASSQPPPGPQQHSCFGFQYQPLVISRGVTDQANVYKTSSQPTAIVVCILERRFPLFSKSLAGYLVSSRHDGAVGPRDLFVNFVPLDRRVIRARLMRVNTPEAFLQGPKTHNILYEARFTRWPREFRFPECEILAPLGTAGDIEVESKALLMNFGISQGDAFGPEIDQQMEEYSGEAGWSIPPEEIANRRDLRNLCIFSIDPTTARDLDDALSITKISDDDYEIGVHIADPTHFFPQNSPLDLEAQERCTTVYLVHRAIPMLPRVLCERLCSLTPGADKLAFSCIFHVNRACEVQPDSVWYGRTVIRSCGQLDYQAAQAMIEGRVTRGTAAEALPSDIMLKLDAESGFGIPTIVDKVLQLHQLAATRRRFRFDTGSLSLNKVKLSFVLDDADLPIEVGMYVQKSANRLIEEFMLLANQLVAQKLLAVLGPAALLRRHPPLNGDSARTLAMYATARGFPIDIDSAAALHASLQRLKGKKGPGGYDAKYVIEEFIMKAMKPAQYVSAGNPAKAETLCRHYALNFGLYTHFTSPIRRYADCTVHRQLAWAIADPATRGAQPYEMREVRVIGEACNEKKEAAKAASDQSGLVYLCGFLRGQPRVERGVVIDMGKQSFMVLVPKYGFQRLVDLRNDARMLGCEVEGSLPAQSVNITWNPEKVQPASVRAGTQRLELLDPVQVMVSMKTKTPIDVQLTLLPTGWTPSTPEEERATEFESAEWLPDVNDAKVRISPDALVVD